MKNILLSILILSVLFLFGCKQNSEVNPPSTTNPLQSPLSTYKSNGAVSNKALGTVRYKSYDINYYGDRTASGEVSKIRAFTVHKSTKSDTVMHLTFDDYDQAKSMFFTVNGKVLPEIYKFSYQDSLIIVSLYGIDASNKVTQKNQLVINKNDYNVLSSIKYARIKSSSNSLLINKVKTALTIIAVSTLAAIAFESVLVGAIIAVPFGLYVGITGITIKPEAVISKAFFTVQKAFKEGLHVLDDFDDTDFFKLVNDAEANDAAISPNMPLSPDLIMVDINLANQNNNTWNWCACAANFVYPFAYIDARYPFSSSSGYSDVKDANINISIPSCFGASAPTASVVGTRYFRLQPGRTIEIPFSLLGHQCEGSKRFQKTYRFTCNN